MRAGFFAVLAAALLPFTASGDETAVPQSRLSELLSSEDDSGFETAIAPRAFVFPADHGPHPGFRNEWWYVTGNLDGDGGRRFGFELTIFRFALTPTLETAASSWRSNQVYIAHFAVTDAGRERFYTAERYSRGALGLAGASADPFRVWIDDWEIATEDPGHPEQWRLRASDAEFALDVALTAANRPSRGMRPTTIPSPVGKPKVRCVSAKTRSACRACPGSIASGAAARLLRTNSAGTGSRCSYPTAAN
jgi:predicted secreted hydrolase